MSVMYVRGIHCIFTFEWPEYVSIVELAGGVYDDKSIKPNSGCLEVGFEVVVDDGGGGFFVIVAKLFTETQQMRMQSAS